MEYLTRSSTKTFLTAHSPVRRPRGSRASAENSHVRVQGGYVAGRVSRSVYEES